MKKLCLSVLTVFVVLFTFSAPVDAFTAPSFKDDGRWQYNDKGEVRFISDEDGVWHYGDEAMNQACNDPGKASEVKKVSMRRVDFFHHVSTSEVVICDGQKKWSDQRDSEKQLSWHILLTILAMVIMLVSVVAKLKGRNGFAIVAALVAVLVAALAAIAATFAFAAALAALAAIALAAFALAEGSKVYWSSVVIFYIATTTILLVGWAF